MSKKHDLLYSKARYVLNQRYIKRPWFKLNPFLEKTDETIDLDDFLPDESKYQKPLQSLVLSESLHCNVPADKREITVDQFWEFVYSEEWRTCCTLRVLDGQLLDLLLSTIDQLERREEIVSHETFAFARNERRRAACYKLGNKEAQGIIKETLLLEFTYYGHLTKPLPNKKIGVPRIVVGEGTPSVTIEESSLVTNWMESSSGRPHSSRSGTSNVSSKSHGDEENILEGPPQSVDKTKRRISVALGKASATISTLFPKARRTSLPTAKEILPMFSAKRAWEISLKGEKLPALEHRTKTSLDQQRVQDVQKTLPAKRTPSLRSRLLLDRKTVLEEMAEKEANHLNALKKKLFCGDGHNYGEEFYLTDEAHKSHLEEDSVQMKLRKRRDEMRKAREEKKQFEKEWAAHLSKSCVPKLPPLTDEQIKQESLYVPKPPGKAPTMEEFCEMQREEEEHDPRYKRNRAQQKAIRLVQKYNLATDEYLHREGLIPSPSIKRISVSASEEDRMSDSSVKSSIRFYPPKRLDNMSRSPAGYLKTIGGKKDTFLFADLVGGVTSSPACKAHCLHCLQGIEHQTIVIKTPKGEKKEVVVETIGAFKHDAGYLTPKICLTTPDDVTIIILRGQTGRDPTKKEREHTEDRMLDAIPEKRSRKGKRMFPKVRPWNGRDSDSPDTDSEDEEEEFSARLNKKYSIDRLKKKRKAKKKKPVFFDVLKKYYRMQAVFKAFNKGTSKKDDAKQSSGGGGKMSLRKFLRRQMGGKEDEKKEGKMVIGKLKKFDFLERKKQKAREEYVDFSFYSSKSFVETFHKALDDFVVRREIVTSNHNWKCVTSITLTRKSIFRHIGI